MAGTPDAEGVGAYFAFYLLAMGSGRPRRTDELTALLHTAGFTGVRLLRDPPADAGAGAGGVQMSGRLRP